MKGGRGLQIRVEIDPTEYKGDDRYDQAPYDEAYKVSGGGYNQSWSKVECNDCDSSYLVSLLHWSESCSFGAAYSPEANGDIVGRCLETRTGMLDPYIDYVRVY